MKQGTFKVKPKKCRGCKKPFLPRNSLQVVCSPSCAAALVKVPSERKKVEDAETKKWVKEKREELKTTADWKGVLQAVFNTYIRLRDKDLGCVSCGTPMQGRKGDASHLYSVGSYPNLRYHEDNVHLACVACNQHKGGNLIEYALRLPQRIGHERFDALTAERNSRLSLTEPEIKELIAHYKQKIKEMKG